MEQGDAENASQESAVGPGAIASSFAPLLGVEMCSRRLGRIRITSHHNIKGQVMTTDMQCGEIRFAEKSHQRGEHSVRLGYGIGPL